MHDLELYIIARPTWMSHLKVIQFYWNLIISLQVISRASPALYININTLTKFIYLVYLHYSLNSVHAIDWNITNAFHKTSIKENRERLRSDNACVWVSVNHINSVCVCVCVCVVLNMILSDRATLTPAGQRMTLLLLYYVYYTSNKVNVSCNNTHRKSDSQG